MNRYMVIRSVSDTPGSSNSANWMVVDLQTLITVADCGDNNSQATKVAQALNEFDGGPL